MFACMPAIQRVALNVFQDSSIAIDCLRLDSVHPFISGNKWYKLKHHLISAIESGQKKLLSFGGAHSNHLHALAYAGRVLNIPTTGIVRGEAAHALTATLEDCVKWGMQLYWLNRLDYRHLAPTEHCQSLRPKYPDSWIIPEGGEGEPGVRGVRELFSTLFETGQLEYDYIICPVGSGATLAGIASANIGRARCIGFSALKGAYDLESRIEHNLKCAAHVNHWQLCHQYHFGGFAKVNNRLTDFISEVYQQHNLLLDPVYTGKALYGLVERLRQKRLPADARMLFVHTGGLQGWRGFGAKALPAEKATR